MVLQSTAPCCTPHPGVKVNLLLQNIAFSKDELYQVLKGFQNYQCQSSDVPHGRFGAHGFGVFLILEVI